MVGRKDQNGWLMYRKARAQQLRDASTRLAFRKKQKNKILVHTRKERD